MSFLNDNDTYYYHIIRLFRLKCKGTGVIVHRCAPVQVNRQVLLDRKLRERITVHGRHAGTLPALAVPILGADLLDLGGG